MAACLYDPVPVFRSRLSFQPLIAVWDVLAQGSEDNLTCAALSQKFKNHPELQEPIDDFSILHKHKNLVSEAMSTIFPASLGQHTEAGAAAVPFSTRVVFATPYFRSLFLKGVESFLLPLDQQVEENIKKAEIHLAYQLILKHFYNLDLHGGHSFLCAYPDPAQDIHNYFELSWDPQFIVITPCASLPQLPASILRNCHHTQDLERFPELRTLLPLEDFIFDGLILIHIEEVTERETVKKISNLLLDEDVWERPGVFKTFTEQVQYLLQWKGAEVGVSTFHTYDQLRLAAPQLQGILFGSAEQASLQEAFSSILQAHFTESPHYIWTKQDPAANQLDEYLAKTAWETATFTALEFEGTVIGFVEVYTQHKGLPAHKAIARLNTVAAVLKVSLEKCHRHLQNKLSRLVMDHFTAVQGSVEWRFNEAAMNYLLSQQKGNKPQMESILFTNVFPLYGSVDIRNSSGERNKAVQQDMLHQLQWISTILEKVRKGLKFPLLDQLLLRVEQQRQSIESFLFINDEQSVYAFLKLEAAEMLQQLKDIAPLYREEIDAYFAALDSDTGTITNHQQLYEESVTQINNHIAHLLQEEQAAIQESYPHYFERFVTDGVEFNIYMGQAIAPGKPFNSLHLKNLRLWQLSFLARVAREIHQLSPQLPIPMDTTQLVLVYSDPLSISFRTAERKFDVDGVYNARYEVVKKRIDKALVRGTNQRLTQPGQIAVVYSGLEEEREYLQYFHYLQTTGRVAGEPEHLELEELQGVSGLKALRAQAVLPEAIKTPHKRKVSKI